MDWSDHQAREEIQWLRFIARLKYDSYRDFQAGMRFIESLAKWLQQFEPEERKTAYNFVRNSLVYIGPSEMERLVEQFYPNFVQDRLVKLVAKEQSLPPYRVLADSKAIDGIRRLRRQTLFMGMSDGARMDTIRHANVGLLSNEQFVGSIQVDNEKWEDLRDNLRDDLNDELANFQLVYLVDDFTASGLTFLREDKKKDWNGKLIRFRESINSATRNLGTILAPNWKLCVHHYIASAMAEEAINERLLAARHFLSREGWASEVEASFSMVLPAHLPVNTVNGCYDDFIALAEKYYDPVIETEHTKVGGVSSMSLGYAGCALPVVLEHNTPNNSVALLWAETDGGDRNGITAHPMRPLFRRRQRHT